MFVVGGIVLPHRVLIMGMTMGLLGKVSLLRKVNRARPM